MAPSQRFGSLSPTFGPLRRLKTVFSSSSNSDATSGTSTDTTSPLSRSASPSGCSESDFSPLSFMSYDSSRSSSHSHNKGKGAAHQLPLRSRPSILDIEMAEERRSFGHELEMLEPRPTGAGAGVGLGIFEVLDGRA